MAPRIVVMLALAGALCLCVFSGAASAQTLDRIAASQTIHIGFIPDQAPFAIPNADGPPTGYAIDLCNRVVTRIRGIVPGIAVSYVETSLTDAFDAVAAGRIDLLCGAVTATLGRRETVDFSEPIFVTGASALLRTDSPRDLRELFLGERTISPPRSLEMRSFQTSHVGVRADTTTETLLRRAVSDGGYSATVVRYPTHEEGLAALEAREIDAYFADRALLIGLLNRAQHPSRLVLGTRLLTQEAYGIAMARGDADLRLLVDRVLSAFYATPDFALLLATYFGDKSAEFQLQIKASAMPE
ncbi:amino acid ABC transporter substrate-binding protein [Hypericibacter terrae]|uniref:Amino acid ABC transporter substrate-binding protein n=1 Tax=Hypericibacter terrae TaxID=2602015 RepID=A0A5J6MGQ3_9PROT|nr:amino acid ABC transporter substrate-binding protein [Hypericibacter terrae]QEX16589.1 amino acid ABC transporter substrate-binding protein [Hypericibacter terrae]